jgi:asparagine synthase (glutamine-hydrolysing)
MEPEIVRFVSPHEAGQDKGEVEAKEIDAHCARVIGQAIRKRIEHSDVTPVVLALSGGIDSSLMAGLARSLSDRLTAVTVFDSSECQDREYAGQLSQGIGLTHQTYQISLSEFLDEFPRIVLEIAGPNPGYTPYFLGRAMKRFYPSAKVRLCGEGADEFFIGYRLLLEDADYRAKSLSALRGFPSELTIQSSLLRQVWQWESMDREEAWLSLVGMFQREQLVNLHLVPFDHGTMAHGVECRVPFLDYGVVQFIQKVPARLRVFGDTTKVLLRILLAQTLGRDSVLVRALLTRLPSPAFFSTLGCRQWLNDFLREKISSSKLGRSELVKFAANDENLFWLASVATIFLKHRGHIDGMRFADLAHEVLTAAEL